MTEGERGDPAVDRFLELLDIERLDRDLFRADANPNTYGNRLFGGQVAAQSLRAAVLTVDVPHHPHSLHGYFLRPGATDAPVLLHVDRIRDGGSFTTRTVVARQDGQAIFNLSASFHKDEEGGTYNEALPEGIPDPESDFDWVKSPFSGFSTMSPFEVLEMPIVGPDAAGHYESTRRVWIRTRGRLPDDRALHASVAAFVSDMGAVFAAAVPVGGGFDAAMAASLDHALWFHRPFRMDEWTLFDLHPVSNNGNRGYVRGSLRSRDGSLGASITQEALIRLK